MKTTYDMDSVQVDSNSRSASTKTLQILLEKYLTDKSALSSFSEILSQGNKLQANDSAITEKAQDHVNSHVPPPLLHRPTKRSLEHSHLNITSPDSKHPRLEKYYDYTEQHTEYGRVSSQPSNASEQMFEKTRSLENSLKPLGPPPPLLKQTPVDRNGPQFQISPHIQKAREVSHDPTAEWSVVTDNDGCKNKTASLEHVAGNKRTLDHSFQQKEAIYSQPESPVVNGKQKVVTAQPVPRQITTDDEYSCGGYAFDHTAMPKIVAVHSVSRSTPDEDEWKRNKAFISKVKGVQDKSYPSRAPLEERGHEETYEVSRFPTRSVSSQNQERFVQDRHGYKDTNQSDFANIGKSSTEVSFERFVLYHLLSKFQGNVEQVKRVLKVNLLQEWLAYSQGNMDPRQQTLNGVNFYELRKLYEVWCQLQKSQRKNGIQSDCLETSLKSRNSESTRVKPGSELSFQKNQENGIGDSQRSPSSQHFKGISHLQRNCSTLNMTRLNQAVHQTSVNQAVPQTSVNPSPVPFNTQRVHNNTIGGETRNRSIKNVPLPILEKIYSLSQSSSSNGKIGSKPTSPSVSPSSHNQHGARTPEGNRHGQSSTNQVFAYKGQQVTLNRPDINGGNTNISHFRPVSGYTQRNDVEKEPIRGTNLSPRASVLRHFPQTTSKPTQHESLSFVSSKPSSENTIFRNNVAGSSCRESVQSHYHPLEEAAHSDFHGNDFARGQETKASYLWRFKGGKLISDNMPNNNTGEPVTEIELTGIISDPQKSNEMDVLMEVKREGHTSGQQSCHKESASMSFRQTSHPVISAAEQQHRKVCGAAASGKRCYCLLDLEPKGGPQSGQRSIDPIQSMQQMINRAAESPPRQHATPIPAQRPNIKMEAATTDSSQVYQRPSTIVSISQDNQQSSARVNVSFNGGQTRQQSKASFHVTPNTLANQQSYTTVNVTPTAQGNKQPIVSLHLSSAAQASRLSDLDISANGQALQPSNADLHVSGNVKERSNGNFHVSFDKQANQQSNSTLHVQRNEPTTQQPNANQLRLPPDIQTNQLLIPSHNTSRNSQTEQQPVGNTRVDISRIVQQNQQSNPSIKLPHTAQIQQLSNGSFQVPRNAQLSQHSNIKLNVSYVSTKAVVRIAPKVESGISCEKEKPKKTETSIAIKSEKTNDKQCSFLTSLPPKKKYTSLQQLAKKVIETRKRFKMEIIPWKKKILKSLEGVLMKRLRKIERETGEQANLDGETETD